jgi:hypothetical protein
MMRLFNLSGPRAAIDTKSRVLWWSCSALLGLMVLFGIGSIVALSVDCSPLAFAQASATARCPELVPESRVIGERLVLTMAAATSVEADCSARRRHRSPLGVHFRPDCLARPAVLPVEASGRCGLCIETAVSKQEPKDAKLR